MMVELRKRKNTVTVIIFDSRAGMCESGCMKKPALGGLGDGPMRKSVDVSILEFAPLPASLVRQTRRTIMDDATIRYFALQLAMQMLPDGANPDDVIALAGKLVAFMKAS